MAAIAEQFKPVNQNWLFSLIGVGIWLSVVIVFVIFLYPNRRKTATPFLYPTPALGRNKSIKNNVTFISHHIKDRAYLNSLIQTHVFSTTSREPENDDEVHLDKGDELVVYYVFSDAWAYGKNLRSGLPGMFPLCVCMVK